MPNRDLDIVGQDVIGYLTDIIENLEIEVKVDSSVDNGDGTYTVNTCNTQYLYPCFSFEINNQEYFIDNLEVNKSFTYTGPSLIEDSFFVRIPLFIPDTPIGANNELLLRKSDIDRHPFIWLVDNFEVEKDFRNSLNVGEARVKLFLLTMAVHKDWLHEDHRNNCVRPMKNLASVLLNNIERKLSGKIESCKVKNLPRFGVYVNNQGNKKTVLDEELSGIGLDLTLPIRKWAVKCKKC